MWFVGSPVPFDNIRRFLPAVHGVVGIEATVYPKHVFVVVPHFINQTACASGVFAMVGRFPLAASKDHDGNVLVWIAGLPLRMTEDKFRATFRHHRISFVRLTLFNQH